MEIGSMPMGAARVTALLVATCVAASVSVAQTAQPTEPAPSASQAEHAVADRKALARAYQEARDLRDTDPARYVAETEAYLERGERLALADPSSHETRLLRRNLAEAAHHAGSFARLTLHDAQRALRLYRRSLALRAALQGSERLGAGTHMAIADTLRFDAKNTAEALAEYRTLLGLIDPLDLRDEDSNRAIMRAIMQWARAEIAYLAKARRSSGAVPMETVVSLALAIDLGTQGLAADDRPLDAIHRALNARTPSDTEREAFAAELEALSPSQSRVLSTFSYLPVLGTPERIDRYLRRHDPTGFVTRGAFTALKTIEREGKGNHVGMHVQSWSVTDRSLMRNAERLALR